MAVKQWILIGLGATALLPQRGTAQTVQERLDTLEKKVAEQGKGLATTLGVDVHAMVAVDYLYSFNNPDSDMIEYRVFDADHNSFTLNQANLNLSRSKADENLGFVINMDFGKTAEVVGAVTCWNHDCDSGEQDNSFELREAYLTYKLPIGAGITLKAGKFVTLLGYEIIKNYNAINPNISNSILFGFSIPFTHTGLLASFPLGEYVSADVGVVNGWDSVVDNNDGKSLLAGVKVAPSETFSTYIAGTYGTELTDNGKSKRGIVTANATLTPSDFLTLAIDLNYANENDEPGLVRRDGSGGLRDADWYGAAAYTIYELTEELSFRLRAEIFDDPDGVRSLFTAPGRAPGVTVWEITPTLAYQVTDGLLARVEYRHDEADRPFFGKEDRVQSGSDTVAAELLYAF